MLFKQRTETLRSKMCYSLNRFLGSSNGRQEAEWPGGTPGRVIHVTGMERKRDAGGKSGWRPGLR